jgi:hypothetical protein
VVAAAELARAGLAVAALVAGRRPARVTPAAMGSSARARGGE